MNQKLGIKVLHTEKELYRIFKRLEKYGRTTINYPSNDIQNSISRKISWRTKNIPVPDYFIPPHNLRSSRRIKSSMSICQLPIDVKIEETKFKNFSRFRFFKDI